MLSLCGQPDTGGQDGNGIELNEFNTASEIAFSYFGLYYLTVQC